MLEPNYYEADEVHDKDKDDDNDHLGAVKDEACFQGTDDADATFHGGQCGQEVGEEKEDSSLPSK